MLFCSFEAKYPCIWLFDIRSENLFQKSQRNLALFIFSEFWLLLICFDHGAKHFTFWIPTYKPFPSMFNVNSYFKVMFCSMVSFGAGRLILLYIVRNRGLERPS